MVVLSVSLLNRKGAILLARQYVPMSRLRIEGLLAAFPKLIYSEENARSKQHTFIETDEVRYIYQPMDNLFLLLITNMQSNIIEDLSTLRLIAKLVPDYCMGHDDEAVKENAFDLCFAMDEVISPMGYREAVSSKDIQKFTEMDSAEEKLSRILEDSKIQNQQQFMKEKAKTFDDIRARARQAATGASTGGSGSFGADLISQLSTGITTLRERGLGGGGGGSSKPVRSYPLQSSGSMQGFGSDSVPSKLGGASSSSSATPGFSSSSERIAEMYEDHGLGREREREKKRPRKTRSGPRAKGLSLGKKSKESDDLMRDALKADESAMTTSAAAALRDMKTMAAARASGASAMSGMSAASTAAAAAEASARSGPMTDVELTVSEKFSIKMDREGVVKSFEIRGDFEIAVNNPDCGQCVVVTGASDELKAPPKKHDGFGRIGWKVHPRMDAKLWNTKGVLRLKEAGKKFKIGRMCKTSVLKWRMATKNEDMVPLTVDYWPEVELGKVHVTLQYNVLLAEPMQVSDCVISLPLPTSVVGKGAEIDVESIDGSYNFDKRNGELAWIVPAELQENDTGMFEFRVEPGSGGHVDVDKLWPVAVHFNVDNGLFSGLRVDRVVSSDGFDPADLSAATDFENDVSVLCTAENFAIGADASSD